MQERRSINENSIVKSNPMASLHCRHTYVRKQKQLSFGGGFSTLKSTVIVHKDCEALRPILEKNIDPHGTLVGSELN